MSADGDANVRLGFGDGPDQRRLEEIAHVLDARVFGGTALRTTIDTSDPGDPFLVLRADAAFEPGPRPAVAIDLREMCADLLGLGYRTIEMSLVAPRVPHAWEVEPGGSWTTSQTVTECDQAPHGLVTIHPQPLRWLGARALVGTRREGMALTGLPAQLSDTRRDALGRTGRSVQTTQVHEGANQIQRTVISKKLGLSGSAAGLWQPSRDGAGQGVVPSPVVSGSARHWS